MAKQPAMEQSTAIRQGAIRPRHLLTVATVAIVVIGCLAVLSAADGAASGSAFAYFAKASVLGTAGLILMAYLGRGGRKGNGGLAMAHRLATILLGIGFAGVIFVMVPTPITPEINGARQWVSLGPITIQPSEILKPALVLYLAASLARQPWRTESLHALRPILGVAVAGLAVVAAQDLGSALVTGGIVMSMFFIAGVPGRMLGVLMGGAVAGAVMLTLAMPERVSRMTVFLHPFEDRFDAGFQITNGLMAIGQGGVFGSGIGESLQKHIMPEPQTDFILPVIMEEVGLLGATVIIALYVVIVMLGLRIARGTQDPYERLVAAGLASIMLWQAALNIWVVLGIAPLTGVPLPLISAGSTSQLLILGAIGLLIDIDRRSATPTVPLVMPEERPEPVRRERPVPVAQPAPAPAAAPAPAPTAAMAIDEPASSELRVVDQRPASAPSPATPEFKVARTANPNAAPTASRRFGRATVPAGSAPAPSQRPQGRPAARPAGPSVVERIANMELLSDGTVRLPNGRIGRPKSPIVLPDGRVLMPDGSLVSRERAAAVTAASRTGSTR